MSYGVWLSAAGMQVNAYRQDIMANNLANASTVGFKRDLAVFHERQVASRADAQGQRFQHPILDAMTGGTFVQPTVHTFEQGELEHSNNPLDVAIEGSGFLKVDDGGEPRYTRDGRMTLNPDGELVLVAGGGRVRVVDDAGNAVRLDTDQTDPVVITHDGRIQQGQDEIAKLQVVDFDDTGLLTKQGGNLYQNHGAAITPSASRVHQYYTERSTSNPVRGLASMIEVSRMYELNANLISLQDHTIGQAVSTVGRIG
jgi:flagellar basal-body rod protein FlgG